MSKEFPIKTEAQLQAKYTTVKDGIKAKLSESLTPLAAAGDDTKMICEKGWCTFADHYFEVVQHENTRHGLLKEVQQLKVGGSLARKGF